MRNSLKFLTALGLCSLAHLSAQVPATKPSAETSASPTQKLKTIEVYGESENENVVHDPFPMPVEGTKIFAGKRASVIDLDALPKVQANNYRQALALTAGLQVSEETTPLVSIGYRGIGTPARTQFMQVLQDGIPIHADPFGYPEAYYTPPLDVVDRIEFIRGGGALMYGPQPGGALNYITHTPLRDSPFGFRTQNIMGTDDLFSSYSAITGTVGPVGYYGYYNHRQSEGFRRSRSAYQLDGGHFKTVTQLDADTRFILAFDAYEQSNEEPGGLSWGDYARDRNQNTRNHDFFRLQRYCVSAELQKKISSSAEFQLKTWAGYYDRYSHRQRLSSAQGSDAFGVRPLSDSSSIEKQTFYSLGIEPRTRVDWKGLGGDHTLAAGMQLYLMDSPRRDKLGASAGAADGILTGAAQRYVTSLSTFIENKFTWGDFSITPGFRLESIHQSVHSKKYDATSLALTQERDVDRQDIQPLFGLGLAYDLPAETQLYANVSQSYRPALFTESVVVTPGSSALDASPGLNWSYELGYRGKPRDYFTFDSSLFVVDQDNRFALSNNVLASAGRSLNSGWDGAMQLDLVGAWDALQDSQWRKQLGSLSLYANVTLLDASLHGGPNDGGKPQYAPQYMLRSGLIYSLRGLKLSLLSTFVDDQKAQDSSDPRFDIPAYSTWDLTAEIPLNKTFSLMAGINNLFNEDYFSRVTSNGIDPAYGRNVYFGGSLQF